MKTILSLSIDVELAQKLKEQARREHMTVSAWISSYVQAVFDQRSQPKKKGGS